MKLKHPPMTPLGNWSWMMMSVFILAHDVKDKFLVHTCVKGHRWCIFQFNTIPGFWNLRGCRTRSYMRYAERQATRRINLNIYFSSVQANCTLKTLDLSWNGFGNEGAMYLADALKANNTLIELDIRYMRRPFVTLYVGHAHFSKQWFKDWTITTEITLQNSYFWMCMKFPDIFTFLFVLARIVLELKGALGLPSL